MDDSKKSDDMVGWFLTCGKVGFQIAFVLIVITGLRGLNDRSAKQQQAIEALTAEVVELRAQCAGAEVER